MFPEGKLGHKMWLHRLPEQRDRERTHTCNPFLSYSEITLWASHPKANQWPEPAVPIRDNGATQIDVLKSLLTFWVRCCEPVPIPTGCHLVQLTSHLLCALCSGRALSRTSLVSQQTWEAERTQAYRKK